MTTVTINATDGGSFDAYLAIPAGGKGPGLVLIQEIFGVNASMRALCDHYAALGYTAICPDLFWRQEPGVQLTDQTEAEWQRAFQLYNGFSEASGVEDLIATVDFLRGHEATGGKVGTLGYCLGGKLAFLMATRSDADANVSYYGVGLDGALGEVSAITKPLMLHTAGKDKFSSDETRAKVNAAIEGNHLIVQHVYPEQDHAFARVGGEHYDAKAADLANQRTATFLKETLA
ncbi:MULTISPECIES: dienelactone hydrolase family protein [Nitrospirillum]|uniref:Carboxymethylenebutenolidase n=1 Tax=Nitrospirillum amazonense TaxID=28077 RepID=A0A560EX40_9PROT|nr:dienelactone hydrolase family protein [Nitrospirillum amazonense]MEC4592778.1 dienelactone hydrolase family protein [Nitrospirillum amazonense]TWB13913.1 carboxymethylenebutenolidase [Nitrospirillum amazonense]